MKVTVHSHNAVNVEMDICLRKYLQQILKKEETEDRVSADTATNLWRVIIFEIDSYLISLEAYTAYKVKSFLV